MRDGWIETTLGDVAEWWSGGTPKAREPKYYENGTIPWAVIADMSKGIIDSTNSYITKEGLELIGGRLAPVGSVLISMYASVGKSAIANIPLATNQAIAWSIPNQKKIIPYYLYLVSQQLEKEISDLARGATQRNINRQMLKEFTFQLPPLTEQKRIVDLISSVDSYIEALQQQLESAKKSRNAVLHELLTAGGDDWNESLVSDLISHSIGGIWGEDAGEDEVDVRVVRSTEFTPSGFLNFSTGVTRSVRRSQLLSRELKPGDILLEKSGGGPTQPVGRVVFVDEFIPPGTVCSNFVLLIRPNQELVNQRFLFNILLLWHFNNRTLEFQAQTTGIRNLRTNDYLDQVVQIPPLSVQGEIVSLIDNFDVQINKLDQTLHKAQSLRSGLLVNLLNGAHEIPSSYDKVMGAA